jgi:hypothetical protein
MAGPDGAPPLFNDAWEGPAVANLHVASPVTVLDSSGYVVLRTGAAQLVADLAPLCPPHLPAHAHADALSIELWADGRRLVADPGAAAYSGPLRDPFRATAAHATLAVDGADQCLFWGDFRAAHLPRVTRRSIREEPGGWRVLSGEHDGYMRLARGVVHRRTICWHPEEGVVLADVLIGTGRHDVTSRLPLFPEAAGRPHVGPFRPVALAADTPQRVASRYAPYLGTIRPTEAIVVERRVGPGEHVVLGLLRDGNEVRLEGDRLEVSGRAPLSTALE